MVVVVVVVDRPRYDVASRTATVCEKVERVSQALFLKAGGNGQ